MTDRSRVVQDDEWAFVPDDYEPDEISKVVDDLVAILAPSDLALFGLTEPNPVAPAWGHGDSRTSQRRNSALRDTLRAGINSSCRAGNGEPLLDQLRRFARLRDEADRNVRLLLAYALTAAPPSHAHPLRELSQSVGMTTSGVRTAYTEGDLGEVTDRLSAGPSRAAGIRRRADSRKR